MEESLKTIRLIHRVFLVTCLTVAFLALTGGSSEHLSRASQELLAVKGVMADGVVLAEVARAREGHAVGDTLGQMAKAGAFGPAKLAPELQDQRLAILRAPAFKHSPEEIDRFFFEGVPQLMIGIPLTAVQGALNRADGQTADLTIEAITLHILPRQAVANTENWEKRIKALLAMHKRRDTILLDLVSQREQLEAAEDEALAALKQQGQANARGDVPLLTEGRERRRQALTVIEAVRPQLQALEAELSQLETDRIQRLAELQSLPGERHQLRPAEDGRGALPQFASTHALIAVTLSQGGRTEEIRVPAELPLYGAATSRTSWLGPAANGDTLPILKLPRPAPGVGTLFPMLDAAGLKEELYQVGLSDALRKIDEHIKDGRQQVNIMGVEVDDQAALLAGPSLLCALFLYLVIHVRRARLFWTPGEHANLLQFPWLGLRAQPAFAWQLLCLFTTAVPIATLIAGGYALGDWSAASIPMGIVGMLGIWLYLETRAMVHRVERGAQKAVAGLPLTGDLQGLWYAEGGSAALLVAADGTAEWRSDVSGRGFAHVRGDLLVDADQLTVPGRGASVKLKFSKAVSAHGVRTLYLDEVPFRYTIVQERGGSVSDVDGEVEIVFPEGTTTRPFSPGIQRVDSEESAVRLYRVHPHRALKGSARLRLRLPEDRAKRYELRLNDKSGWRTLPTEEVDGFLEAELSRLADIGLFEAAAHSQSPPRTSRKQLKAVAKRDSPSPPDEATEIPAQSEAPNAPSKVEEG